jgi:DNA mismatch repair protein MutS
MTKHKEDTPMMKQYREARASLTPDTLLLFRLGDFYEMFEVDAERGAPVLGITLTKRHDMAMAGFPFHSAEGYLAKLLSNGYKVAICEQLEAPKAGKLVKRGITRILTPGTVLEERQLEVGQNNFILALDCYKKAASAAWLDLSTGKFILASVEDSNDLLAVFASLAPHEYLIPEGLAEKAKRDPDVATFLDQFQNLLGEVTRTERPDYDFDQRSGAREVMENLGVMNLEGFGIGLDHTGLGAAGALLIYASDVLRGKPGNLRRVEEYRSESALLLDPATQRNLEVFRTSSNSRKGSLLDAMDETITSAGGRLLERYLGQPELDLTEINRRQQCVGEFAGAPGLADQVRDALRGGNDVERILGRLRNRLARPRELGGLRATLRSLPVLADLLREVSDRHPCIAGLGQALHTFDELCGLLEEALEEELPVDIKVDVKSDGGRVIRTGFNEDLDRLRELGSGGKQWILDLETSEREKTGIGNLKVKYNGAFGYFIEVTKANISLVPEHYVRKQTMTNAERYFTEELRQKEKEIVNAEERSVAREQELFREVLDSALNEADALAEMALVLAEIDLYSSWGCIARERGYCRPEFQESSSVLEIEQGRHPVVELSLKRESLGLAGTHAFVPNDCQLSSEHEQICLITGPNMAGKSTFIRQVALIALLAHVGSWVPARACRLGLVDRIFSRVGAGDELARGNSTFMVEMNETANILNNCTDRSLIVLDEIGRGTSTYDGLSIAWAVVEHLHGNLALGPKALFATHYHELTRLSESLPRLLNYSVAVKEWNDEIIFVRQVKPGASERSFGIQVARLAGLPDAVVNRAKAILQSLEVGDAEAARAAAGVQDIPEPSDIQSTNEQLPSNESEPTVNPQKTHGQKVGPDEYFQLELF